MPGWRNVPVKIMQILKVSLLSGLIALSGCARHYIITMSNGSQIVTTSKPKLQGNYYVYKDTKGKDSRIASGMIREVAPMSMSNTSSKQDLSPAPPVRP
jgi:hypothetical protein